MYKKIYKKIKKYNNIVIARHIGPDPDCLAAQIALRDIIKNKFPPKNVYAVGVSAAKFYHFGRLDKIRTPLPKEDSLLIVVDTPDEERIDGTIVNDFAYSIKIDHHPFDKKFCDIELVDEEASSACQMIVDLCNKTRLRLDKETASKLFLGIVSDTNRFLYYYTTPHTFELVAQLVRKFNLDIEELYAKLYYRSLNEVRLQGYIAMNMIVTENRLGYIKIPVDKISEFGVDSSSAGNMINEFNNIMEIITWAAFSQDAKNEVIRGNIRSRGPVINVLASKYGGGGHKYASGVRLDSWEKVDKFIADLDELCKKYLEEHPETK
ncbi:MAG: DHH family phosphoesterase [Bacilli bacterium]|jgi:phosphoesterase RecJ-like protein